jgi:hypothetical protein
MGHILSCSAWKAESNGVFKRWFRPSDRKIIGKQSRKCGKPRFPFGTKGGPLGFWTKNIFGFICFKLCWIWLQVIALKPNDSKFDAKHAKNIFCPKTQWSPLGDMEKRVLPHFLDCFSIIFRSDGLSHFLNTPFDSAFQAEQDRLCSICINYTSRRIQWRLSKNLQKTRNFQPSIAYFGTSYTIDRRQIFTTSWGHGGVSLL